MFGVSKRLILYAEISAYPRSSARIMMTFGLGAEAASSCGGADRRWPDKPTAATLMIANPRTATLMAFLLITLIAFIAKLLPMALLALLLTSLNGCRRAAASGAPNAH